MAWCAECESDAPVDTDDPKVGEAGPPLPLPGAYLLPARPKERLWPRPWAGEFAGEEPGECVPPAPALVLRLKLCMAAPPAPPPAPPPSLLTMAPCCAALRARAAWA